MPGNDTVFFGFSPLTSVDLTVSSEPGNVFDLLGLDAGALSFTTDALTLTIEGTQAGGGPLSFTSNPLPANTLTTLTLNWTDLTNVTFSANDDAGLDNIEVSASEISAVPLPAGLPLLLAGLGGLFAVTRRKT
ncbi:MAG: VPLPA-CTERM sorting domain-containing protein [Roseovarius sp.]